MYGWFVPRSDRVSCCPERELLVALQLVPVVFCTSEPLNLRTGKKSIWRRSRIAHIAAYIFNFYFIK